MKQDLQERWFNWWEDDDGFNIKAGARQDKMDIFFMPDKTENDGDKEKAEENAAEKAADNIETGNK